MLIDTKLYKKRVIKRVYTHSHFEAIFVSYTNSFLCYTDYSKLNILFIIVKTTGSEPGTIDFNSISSGNFSHPNV